MVHRKIQRLEIVVVRLDHRPLSDGIPQLLKHPHHLVRGLNNRMLRPNGTPDAWKSDVDARSRVAELQGVADRYPDLGAAFHDIANLELQFVNGSPRLAV